MKELGLFGLMIPEEYGGMGLDLLTYALIVEEIARGWIAISGIINTHFIVAYMLMKYGTEEQKQKYLPRMATGEIRAAFSMSEPEARLRRAGDQDVRQEGRRRRLRDQRPEDVGDQRPALERLVFVLVKTDPTAEPRLQGASRASSSRRSPESSENTASSPG